MLNQMLRAELLRMEQDDLELRAELAHDGSLFQGYAGRMAALHSQHNARLRAILREHGWPGKSVVGEDGARAAWTLLQHAVLDPGLMRSALPLLERAVQVREADPKHLALLVDRIRVLEGRPQLYGTSHDWDSQGRMSPRPIEDPAGVEERRRQVGLEPLAENTRRLREQAEEEGQSPPADYEERQREINDWAQSIGWRG